MEAQERKKKIKDSVNLLDRYKGQLRALGESGLRRYLIQTDDLEDFCSNDYLGLSKVWGAAESALKVGAGGSRLVSGNTHAHESMEAYLADFHEGDSSLIFNSGYNANIGVLSCLLQRGDTILYDKRCHASIRDGIRLSFARSFGFRHNDLADLESKLEKASGAVLIVVESLYSMDGDFCPLGPLLDLAESYGAKVMLDEAHTTGIFGDCGQGYAVQGGLAHRLFVRVHTWGKAVGNHGACVIVPRIVKEWLINHSRSFMYTTALSPSHLGSVLKNYQELKNAKLARMALRHNVEYTRELFTRSFGDRVLGDAQSPIVSLLVPGNNEVTRAAAVCRSRGFAVVGIRSPTVPVGQERIRICLHAFNSFATIAALLKVLEQIVTPSPIHV